MKTQTKSKWELVNLSLLNNNKTKVREISVIGVHNAEKVMDTMMEMVDDKDPRVVTFLAGRILPEGPKGQLFPYPLPPLDSMANIELAMMQVWDGFRLGKITSGECDTAFSLIERVYKMRTDHASKKVSEIIEAFARGEGLEAIKKIMERYGEYNDEVVISEAEVSVD